MSAKTILYYPLADSCPNGCEYCFEDPKKTKSSFNSKYDKYQMKSSYDNIMFNMGNKKLEKGDCNKCGNKNVRVNGHTTLHGGEVFSLPMKDFEFFVNSIAEYNSVPSIQSSLGVPITQEHIRILRKYNVNVGCSVDGPRELNILRGPRNPDANKRFQDTVYENLDILRKNKVSGGILTVLSRANAVGEKLDKLIDWNLETRRGGRFNPLFPPFHDTEGHLTKYVLSPGELKTAYFRLYDTYLNNSEFNFALAREMTNFLLGKHEVVCSLTGCDYITTECNAILPDGNISRCDRTFQDGYYYVAKKENSSSIRSAMLEQTECLGCRYFQVCRGGCPAEGKDKDFRSKTIFCEAIYALYEKIEGNLRKSNPGIVLSIDIENYFEDYFKTRVRFNPYMRDPFYDQTTNGRGVRDIKFITGPQSGNQRNRSEPQSDSGYRHLDGWR